MWSGIGSRLFKEPKARKNQSEEIGNTHLIKVTHEGGTLISLRCDHSFSLRGDVNTTLSNREADEQRKFIVKPFPMAWRYTLSSTCMKMEDKVSCGGVLILHHP